nr:uncharacterized GPI-anchored protein At4g28100-like [Ipomoea batatas]
MRPRSWIKPRASYPTHQTQSFLPNPSPPTTIPSIPNQYSKATCLLDLSHLVGAVPRDQVCMRVECLPGSALSRVSTGTVEVEIPIDTVERDCPPLAATVRDGAIFVGARVQVGSVE